MVPLVGSCSVPVSAAESDPYVANEVPVAKGCIVLGRAWAGVKVSMVQHRLGTTHELDRYGTDTLSAVAAFQERRDLRSTGKVNRRTWNALGFERPFCMDRFTVQPKVESARSTTQAHRGDDRAGRVSRSGVPTSGAEPVLLAMTAPGWRSRRCTRQDGFCRRSTPTCHQRRDFATASAIYDSGLRRVPLADRKRGDLVFYGPRGLDHPHGHLPR